MNHNLKMKLRALSRKSKRFSAIYRKASSVKTAHLQDMSDEEYLRREFKESTGQELDLNNPQTFNMKLQWLKLHDRNPLYTTLVDKYVAKAYVTERIGVEHVVPVVGGPWTSADDIDFDTLPEQFVLKCNHDCGSVIICDDKSKLDHDYARHQLNRALGNNYFFVGREWPYKNVKPLVFAEEYMVDDEHDFIIDYKFYCFGGTPKFLYVANANFNNGVKNDQLTFLSLDWTPVPFYRMDHEPFPVDMEKPSELSEMIRIASCLSKDIPFVRIDLFDIKGTVYFSEFTFSPGGGCGVFHPDAWEQTIGSWIDLDLAYGPRN